MQDVCRSCYSDDIDGKYVLPLQAQFRVLAGLGDQMGESFLRQWPTMKPLFNAANRAVLGHGGEPVKAERVQQLFEVVMKVTHADENSLPKFPRLTV
jgi:hypothetical protein